MDRNALRSGFTLMELLIVISIVLLLTLIAIPNLPGVRIEANENSAIASIRSIYSAEVQYASKFPALGFACELSQLGDGAGAPSPSQARMLEAALANGQKSGYIFAVANCGRAAAGQSTSFEVTAVPKIPGKTGHRGFCIDQQGEAKADPAGGTNCTRSLD